MEKENVYYSTGKRKTSVARTWLTPGSGEITINNKSIDEYFTIESLKGMVKQPLVLTNTLESFNVKSSVVGGGISGQAGAVRHGITKALILSNPDLRKALKKAGLNASAYWLRHTYAQNLLEAGASIFDIKEMLGHDKIESTKRYLCVHTKLMRQVLFDETL